MYPIRLAKIHVYDSCRQTARRYLTLTTNRARVGLRLTGCSIFCCGTLVPVPYHYCDQVLGIIEASCPGRMAWTPRLFVSSAYCIGALAGKTRTQSCRPTRWEKSHRGESGLYTHSLVHISYLLVGETGTRSCRPTP